MSVKRRSYWLYNTFIGN